MAITERYISKLFIFACIYLIVLIIGGFFILPGIFGIDNYNFPLVLELFFKITATIAALIVIGSAVVIPLMKLLAPHSGRIEKSPAFVTATTLFLGFVFIFLHGLYVKLKTCSQGDINWYCNVQGKDYVGMTVLVFLVASTLGLLTWLTQKFNKK